MPVTKWRLSHIRPALIYAWRDMKHEEVDSEDWFTDWQVVNYLVDKEENINGQITEDYCKTLEKIELAILERKMSSSEKKNEFLALVVTIFSLLLLELA